MNIIFKKIEENNLKKAFFKNNYTYLDTAIKKCFGKSD